MWHVPVHVGLITLEALMHAVRPGPDMSGSGLRRRFASWVSQEPLSCLSIVSPQTRAVDGFLAVACE